KIFLNRLAFYGWVPPTQVLSKQLHKLSPLSSQAAFFATSKENYERSKSFHAKPIDILLWHLSKDNKVQVIEMVTSKPWLLLQKGNFIDSVGKRFKNISPVEYCNLEKNHQHLTEIMRNCLNTDENKSIQQSLLQSESVNEKEKIDIYCDSSPSFKMG
ncbi:MAG: hypothetical protein H0U73_04955, partial [Tatlockia sp.]|nr:hypothetical protein [Tatlockia sp.]